MVGVAIGVAALIVVLSVMNGFFDFVRDMLVSVDPHVRVVSVDERGMEDPGAVKAEALDLEGVRHASSYVEGRALAVSADEEEEQAVVTVRGVDPEAAGGVEHIVEQTGVGEFDIEERGGRPGLVMPMELGQDLGLVPLVERADEEAIVSLLSAPGIERMLTQPFAVPQWRRFEVRGLYRLEAAREENTVFVELSEAQRLLRMDGRVSGVELRLEDVDRAGEVQRSLQERLDAEQFTVLTWYDLQRSLYDVMQLEKWGATLILLLIIIVAAFNIVGSLTMIVIEKRRDVGVLQAMGVSPKNIQRIFLTEGALIGAIGVGAGFAIGLTLTFLQDRYELVPLAGAESFLLDAYPVSVQAGDLALIAVIAFALCLLAAVYPARRAARVEPARAVQVE